jgi:hypothetical protein
MSTYKRISGDYTIMSVNPEDKINIDTSTVVINGNLVVTGNSQSIVSTDTAITDHTITLNSGVTTPNPSGANIIVARSLSGASPNVFISWNETVKAWQYYNGTTLSNIASASSLGIASVSADANPALGGNLNLSGHKIWDSADNANVQVSFANVGTGGTGVYVNNTSYANVEVISKTRSVAYSILFG